MFTNFELYCIGLFAAHKLIEIYLNETTDLQEHPVEFATNMYNYSTLYVDMN
jgi:hypothetical protein